MELYGGVTYALYLTNMSIGKKLDDLQEESKKVSLQINPLKTEGIRVNTIINSVFKLNGEEIKKSADFCYLGSVVAEDG